MAIEPNDAASVLTDVAAVETRTRQAIRHTVSGTFLIMWGVLTAIGNLGTQFFWAYAWYIWTAVVALGVVAGFAFLILRARRRKRAADMRILYALLAFLAFGTLWVGAVGGLTYRQIDVFWPMLFMLGFVVAGIWAGRFFIYCGILVTAAILAGYYWAGDWLNLWLALMTGGSLIAAGFYLRRVGVAS